MIGLILAVIISYLTGSVPTGYVMAKCLKGIDIREHGSGNIGATNLMRVVGKAPGIIALLLDVCKGVLPVILLAHIFYKPQAGISEPLFKVMLGLACVGGHIWTIFLRFKGGKGVATTIGVFMALAPAVTFIGLAIWLITAFITKYVSASSLAMAVSLPLLMSIFAQPVEYKLLSMVLCVFIFFKHRPNIKRLINGTEYKIGQKAHNK